MTAFANHRLAFSRHLLTVTTMLAGLALIFLGHLWCPTQMIALPGGYILKPVSNSCRCVLVTRSSGDSFKGPAGTISLQVHPLAKAASMVELFLLPDGSFTVVNSDLTGSLQDLNEEMLANIFEGAGLLPEEITEVASMLSAIGAGIPAEAATLGLKHFRIQPMLIQHDPYTPWVWCLGGLLIAGSCIAEGLWIIRRLERHN